MTPPPFVVLSLPRSRSYWLSRYLSYGGWHCGHEEIRHARTLSDVRGRVGKPLTSMMVRRAQCRESFRTMLLDGRPARASSIAEAAV